MESDITNYECKIGGSPLRVHFAADAERYMAKVKF